MPRQLLDLHFDSGEAVPAILQLPSARSAPGVLLIHGFTSRKEAMADSVRGLGGRPLLMVNGRYDRTIRPQQAKALFAAAGEPKEQRWYNGGHWPPARAIDDAAEWLATQLGQSAAQSRLA